MGGETTAWVVSLQNATVEKPILVAAAKMADMQYFKLRRALYSWHFPVDTLAWPQPDLSATHG
jgi:hypothetical protein